MAKRQKCRIVGQYIQCEPRLLLSADLDSARSVVAGGDFEAGGESQFIAFADGNQNNIQSIRTRDLTTDFSRVVQLDSIAGQIDSIAQEVITEIDAQYIVSFDLRATDINGVATPDTNDVIVLFGGENVGTFRGIEKWQTINIAVTATSAESELEFREASPFSDGSGILLDHISVAEVRQIDVVNHSFEEFNANATRPLTQADVPGFFTVGDEDNTPLGLESVSEAADGEHVLTINTDAGRLDRVFANIHTEANASYFVSFALRNEDGGSDSANLRVRWDNQFAGSFTGTSQWQRHGLIVSATDDFSTLLFRESSSNAAAGPQIDDIRIFRIGSIVSDFNVDLNDTTAGSGNIVDYVENDTTDIVTNLSLDFSNGSFLNSATARILDFSGSELLQSDTSGTRISATFNVSTGILRLVGRDTVANYERVLQSLQFNDSNDNPVNLQRRVRISVTDGTETSERPETELQVIPVNDPPAVTELPDIPLPQDNPLTINVGATDPDDTNLNFSISFDGDTFIFGDELPTISQTGQIQLTAETHGSVRVFVNVRDAAGLGSLFSFQVTSPFIEPAGEVPADFAPFSGQRQLSNVTPALRNQIYDSAPPMNIDTSLNYQAIIETADGDIRVDLFAAESPITVNNFVNLAEDGFYDGVTFHRVIDGFVAQGGDPTGFGSGGPGYQFQDELNNGLEFDQFGQLAMANAGPNTNGSQFFFTLNDDPAFAGQHTIFGQVIEGVDVLRAVNLTAGANAAEIITRVRIEIV